MMNESPDYDIGFRDGLKFVAEHLRRAAQVVEQPARAQYDKEGKLYIGIASSGRPFFATKLRELANEIERIITQ